MRLVFRSLFRLIEIEIQHKTIDYKIAVQQYRTH